MMIEIIEKRRSIRNYIDEPISDKDLYDILKAGLHAPSGKDRRPWRFLIVKNKEKRKLKQIAKRTTYSRFLRNAPVLILVYVMTSSKYPIEKDMLSVGACVQNILLAATGKGYGSCVVGELFDMKLQDVLTLRIEKEKYKLACGICIGKHDVKQTKEKTIDVESFFVG